VEKVWRFEQQLAVLRDQASKLSKANTGLASLIDRQNELDAGVRGLERKKKELQSDKEQLEESRTTQRQQLTKRSNVLTSLRMKRPAWIQVFYV